MLDFANIVMPWTKHVRAGRDLLRRAFRGRKQDRRSHLLRRMLLSHLNTNLLAAGDPLV